MVGRDGRTDEAGIPVSEADLARRFDRLSHALDTGKRVQAAAQRPARPEGANYGSAFRLASEFVAGILVGAGLGWGIDRLAGTSPWGLIALLLLGFVAGVFNVVRAAGEMSTRSADGGKAGGDQA